VCGQAEVIRDYEPHRTEPICATATRMVLTKWSRLRTGPSRGCARRSSTCLQKLKFGLVTAALSRAEEKCQPTVRAVYAPANLLRVRKKLLLLAPVGVTFHVCCAETLRLLVRSWHDRRLSEEKVL
jgi:hypothetical protein